MLKPLSMLFSVAVATCAHGQGQRPANSGTEQRSVARSADADRQMWFEKAIDDILAGPVDDQPTVDRKHGAKH